MDTYGCTATDNNPDNCTSIELAMRQWGSSYITLNPSIDDGQNTYNGPTYTMSDWG